MASTSKFNFLLLLTDEVKREYLIDYINNAFAQGLLPNTLRFTFAPYQWPASLDETENRANHDKEIKILRNALKEIANYRLNILQISLQKNK